jgi:hypothetical protein
MANGYCRRRFLNKNFRLKIYICSFTGLKTSMSLALILRYLIKRLLLLSTDKIQNLPEKFKPASELPDTPALLLVVLSLSGAQVYRTVTKIIMVQYLSAICIHIESKVRNKTHSIVLFNY